MMRRALHRVRHALHTRRRLRPVWWVDAALIGVVLLLFVLEAPQRWSRQRAHAAWHRRVDRLERKLKALGFDDVTENQRGENGWQNDIQREWGRP